jgi:hypothetical protein
MRLWMVWQADSVSLVLCVCKHSANLLLPAKSSVVDADDTSKSIILCNLLGVPTSVDKLIKTFEGKTHFLTYMMERHPSVTTNCNILSAILVSPNPVKFVPEIEKIATYLCRSWKQADIPFQDKWVRKLAYHIDQALLMLARTYLNSTQSCSYHSTYSPHHRSLPLIVP